MPNVHDVAAALLGRLGEMTAMKLQKLVYYCQAWHAARNGRPLFPEEIQAWKEGPVVRTLWEEHKGVYWLTDWSGGDPTKLDETEAATVNWVAERYGEFSADLLSRMTHEELPWRLTRGELPDTAGSDRPIPLGVMSDYYARQRADADAAVAHAIANAAIEGVDLDTEWQVRLRDVADGTADPDAVIADEIDRLRRG